MRRYGGDPYWTRARFNSLCPKCGQQIRRGQQIYYYPNGRQAYCDTCGQDCYRDFESCAFDEAMVTGRW